MALPDGYTVRAAARDDAAAITEMFVEHEMLMSGQVESTVEDLYDHWTTPGVDVARDTWVVHHGDEIAAYAGIVKKIPPDTYAAYGGVRPSHHGRGLGTYLFKTVESRAVEKEGGPAAVGQWVDAKDKPAQAILQRRGYGFVRRFWRMDISLDETVPDTRDIEEVGIRPLMKGSDERVAHDVLEGAFAEHWGFTPRTYEEAAVSRWEAEWFDPKMSLVAEAGGRMVAVCINSVRNQDGYVEDIGVLREWRGRGIAEALLLRSFSIFKDAGLKTASLSVDSDNSTGAMRLYERVGMHTGTSYDVYEARIQP